MYHSFYEGNALLGFPLFALLFFVLAFSVVCVSVLRKKSAPRFDALAHLPLHDEPVARPTSAPEDRHV